MSESLILGSEPLRNRFNEPATAHRAEVTSRKARIARERPRQMSIGVDIGNALALDKVQQRSARRGAPEDRAAGQKQRPVAKMMLKPVRAATSPIKSTSRPISLGQGSSKLEKPALLSSDAIHTFENEVAERR